MASKPWEIRQGSAEETLLASAAVPPQSLLPYGTGEQFYPRMLAPPSTVGGPSYWGHPHQSIPVPGGLSSAWCAPSSSPLDSPLQSLFSPETCLGGLERRLRTLASALLWLVRAANGLLGMVDSTMYAAWSTVLTAAAAWQRLASLRRDHLSKWTKLLQGVLGNIFSKQAAGSSSPLTPARPMSSASGSGPRRHIFGARLLAASVLVASLIYIIRRGARQLSPRSQSCPAVALYGFKTEERDCIDINPGEDLWILDPPASRDNPWILVERRSTGEVGFVPTLFVKAIDSKH